MIEHVIVALLIALNIFLALKLVKKSAHIVALETGIDGSLKLLRTALINETITVPRLKSVLANVVNKLQNHGA